ncbi:hypothetical protein DFJ74DRAFT_521621 [Hyaloraphidium curvatum]|nr:hypothetical protein DFJ74DRAFT_521621 [Hyaloraphidium curvatum]
MDVELVLLSHFLPFETIIKRRVERQESSNSVLTAVEGARSGRNSADFPAEERGLLSDKHNKDHPKISGEMKKSPGKMARSASALGIQTHGDLRRAVEDLVKTIDRDLDNNNWSSVDQGWAALDSLAATLPSELEADLLAALPQFSARAVEALCSHKSVSTTIVVVIEHLATRFGTAIGPFFKSTLSGWENLLQRAGLVAHGPGGRAVDHLVSVASSAPLHEVLHWVAVVLESHDGFKKNPVARERAIKVALAYAKVLITERSPRPADLRNCENIVRLACTDASIAMRDGARELWAFLKQHEAPDKIDRCANWRKVSGPPSIVSYTASWLPCRSAGGRISLRRKRRLHRIPRPPATVQSRLERRDRPRPSYQDLLRRHQSRLGPLFPAFRSLPRAPQRRLRPHRHRADMLPPSPGRKPPCRTLPKTPRQRSRPGRRKSTSTA